MTVEQVVAVPPAGLVIGIGAVSLPNALSTVTQLAPAVGFLAAVLVLAQLCADEDLFRAAGR
ncbi:hypothetical protein GCM10023320_80940 [Pseudonocardia adelaidensis]|uniref:Uncharacterized protein n=2 Tax=Pseudonocardia adelaidensis TaxID=648754 RepID=A0ABP9P9U3_9PSEU